jgi:hypothetical protein
VKVAELQVQYDKAQAAVGKLTGSTETFAVDNSTAIAKTKDELEKLREKAEASRAKMRELTDEFIFNKAAAALPAEAALDLAFKMGRVDEQTYFLSKTMQNALGAFDENGNKMIDAGENAAGYTERVLKVREAEEWLQRQLIAGKLTQDEYQKKLMDLAGWAGTNKEAFDKFTRSLMSIPPRIETTVMTRYFSTGNPPVLPGYSIVTPAAGDAGMLEGGTDNRYSGGTTTTEVVYGGAQADGGDYYVTRPTLFLAGEAGPERVSFTPQGNGGNSVVFNINGAQDTQAIVQAIEQMLLDRGIMPRNALR